MLPPTQSSQYQNMKLAEVMESIRGNGVSPPVYSTAIAALAARGQSQLAEEDHDDEGDFEYPTSRAAPINIYINASLKIDGDANTVVLPSNSSPPSSPSSSTNLSAPMTGSPRTCQNGRAEKLTNMVLSALKDAGLLNNGRDTDEQTTTRPLEINVDAGIVLKGSKNTVCSGLPKLVKATGAGEMKAKPQQKRDEDGSVSLESKKRRAWSEPPDVSSVKKSRLS